MINMYYDFLAGAIHRLGANRIDRHKSSMDWVETPEMDPSAGVFASCLAAIDTKGVT